MNLSETAFVAEGWARGNPKLQVSNLGGPIRRTLRWFTSTMEVPLCGHATVASAKTIFSRGDHSYDTIEFHSIFRGQLGASIDWTTNVISLNFPSNPTEKLNYDKHPWIHEM